VPVQLSASCAFVIVLHAPVPDAHVVHAPVHEAEPQQKPPLQTFDEHCALNVHACPEPSVGKHVPELQ
jgi:hypothetical protein